MDADMLRYLTHAACNKVDKLIDAMPAPADEADFKDVNRCIEHVRAHIDARLMQTAVPFVPVAENSVAFSAEEAELNALLGV